MNVEEARVKILHLAAEVAETDDSNIPVLLKKLQGKHNIILEWWREDMNFIFEWLKQYFTNEHNSFSRYFLINNVNFVWDNFDWTYHFFSCESSNKILVIYVIKYIFILCQFLKPIFIVYIIISG